MKFILFIDALDPRDVAQYCPEMAADMIGRYDVGVPRVTPNTVSQAMTGLPQEEMEMMRSTPLFEPAEDGRGWRTDGDKPVSIDEGPERNVNGDPVQGQRRVGIHPYSNILNDLDDEGVRVFQYGTPFCAFVDLDNGVSVHDEMTNPAAPEFMQFASPEVSFMEHDWDLVADSYISDTVLELETLKQIARQDSFDAVFLGYKHIDHCTHWYAPEIKRDLIRVLWGYIQDLREMGHEVMWWSDHGSQNKEEVFRINKWLKENGYLEYEVHLDKYDWAIESGMVDDNMSEQLTLQSPFVDVDWENTVAYSSDAFDSMVDVTPHATDEEIDGLVEDMAEHDAVANVWRKGDYLNPDSEKFWYAPGVIVERDDNVLVVGNVHPAVDAYVADVPDDWEDFPDDSMGMRSGVHSRYGCYGGDVEDSPEITDIHQLRDVMYNFVNPESITEDNGDEDSRPDVAESRLEALGYIQSDKQLLLQYC